MELRSVEIIATALNAARIRYIVVGGLAVNAHGYERFTHDIDLVIGLEPDNIRRALHTLIGIGYQPSLPIAPEDFADEENRTRWHEEKSMLVLKLWSDEHRRPPSMCSSASRSILPQSGKKPFRVGFRKVSKSRF